MESALNRDEARAVCYFLDVGQGTSQVILLGGGRAIVIDGGPDPEARIPLALLKSEKVHTLEALIVSHNDADHDKGAVKILETYKTAIDKLCFLVDRSGAEIRTRARAKEIDKERAIAGLPPLNLIRLEAEGNDPRVIYRSADGKLRLDLLHPNFNANDGRWKNDPNATCGVLRLSCGPESTARRVLFSGDAPVKVWRWMAQTRVINLPMHCDVMTVSHHGGDAGSEDDLRWLYKQAVRCKHAVVSVGTENTYGHPTVPGITSLRDAGVKKILCTQLTKRCCDQPSQSYPSGLTIPHLYSRSHPSQNPNGNHVACAGSVVARVGLSKVTISKLAEHQAAVEGLRPLSHHPLCRA